MAVHRFDNVNGRDVTGLLKGEDIDVQSILEALDEPARFAALVGMIEKVRCEAAACCAEAKAAHDPGAVAVLGNDDEFLELNHVSPTRMKFDDHRYVGDEFTVVAAGGQLGRVSISEPGLYRIYSAVTYSAAFADASIAVSISVTGQIQVGAGRQGVINNTNGHTKATSDIETWGEFVGGDYIDVLTQQNGAAGAIAPIAGESILVVERRPYGTGGPAT